MKMIEICFLTLLVYMSLYLFSPAKKVFARRRGYIDRNTGPGMIGERGMG